MIQSCVRSILTLLVLPLLVLPMLLSSAAGAADLRIRVITPNGEPVANAVVSVPGELTAVALRAEPLEMAQVDIQFDPFVLVVPRGADVVFPNRDRVRHHVYSFARGNGSSWNSMAASRNARSGSTSPARCRWAAIFMTR